MVFVGDPNQLPPIGFGRPFADLCRYLQLASESSTQEIREIGKASRD